MPSTSIRPIGHEDRLSLVEHLDELRSRLILCLIALVVCFAVTYWQSDRLLDWINIPLESTQNLNGAQNSNDPLEQAATSQLSNGRAFDALSASVASLNGAIQALGRDADIDAATRVRLQTAQAQAARAVSLSRQAARDVPRNRERQPVTLGVTEPFITTFSVAGYAALLLCMPFLLFQAYAFILPAFSASERRVAIPFMAMVPVLFVAGVAFGFFVALPRAIGFLQNFNDDNFDILIQANQYYKFSIVLLAVVGLLFQIPVGVLAVTRLGIVTPQQLAKNRGYVLLAIAVLAAVATPTPDPVTMLIAMAPLVVLFELSIVLSRLFKPAEPRRWGLGWSDDEDDEDEEDEELDWDDLDEPEAVGTDADGREGGRLP